MTEPRRGRDRNTTTAELRSRWRKRLQLRTQRPHLQPRTQRPHLVVVATRTARPWSHDRGHGQDHGADHRRGHHAMPRRDHEDGVTGVEPWPLSQPQPRGRSPSRVAATIAKSWPRSHGLSEGRSHPRTPPPCVGAARPQPQKHGRGVTIPDHGATAAAAATQTIIDEDPTAAPQRNHDHKATPRPRWRSRPRG